VNARNIQLKKNVKSHLFENVKTVLSDTGSTLGMVTIIGVPRILHGRGFMWWRSGPGSLEDGSPPVWSRGMALIWVGGTKSPRS